MDKNVKPCKICGKIIAKNAKTCPHCGAKNKKPLFKKWWFWVIIGIIVISVSAGGGDTDPQNNSSTENAATANNTETTPKQTAFSGDCGISAVAEMGQDIIGQPTVTVSITNKTNKNISAVKFYAVPLDVYGEELKGVFTQNELKTDDTIAAGKTVSREWQFLDQNVKTVKLYVYSVFFSDGTEWGNKDAGKYTITENALPITVTGVSGS